MRLLSAVTIISLAILSSVSFAFHPLSSKIASKVTSSSLLAINNNNKLDSIQMSKMNLALPKVDDQSPESLFRRFLATEFGVTNGNAAVYDSSKPFIVREHFEYRERPNENERVVKLFRNRQEERSRSFLEEDKSVNPLIAIPAAPGSGKSTFLVHFPHSTCYQEYCDHIPAIVAPLSFNGGMTLCHTDTVTRKPVPTFGLRILFGAAMAMRSEEWITPTESSTGVGPYRTKWSNLLEAFKGFSDLSAVDAVLILRAVYGANRRVLVLVDELSKVATHDQADKAVMSETLSILDACGFVDVLVSSLSPQYINDLLRGRTRYSDHVVLESLMHYRLGHEECVSWANRLLGQLGKSEIEVDKFAIRFLQSIDLLLSGHPRSLEHLVSQFKTAGLATDSWSKTVAAIQHVNRKSKLSFPKLMRNVLLDLMSASNEVWRVLKLQVTSDGGTKKQILEEALKFVTDESPTSSFRGLLENGGIFIVPKSKYSANFRTTISLVGFFSLVGQIELKEGLDPAVRAALVLFKELTGNIKTNIGELFERAVALTVVCYSLVHEKENSTFGAWLGCPDYLKNRLPLTPPKLTTRIARTIEDMMIPAGGPRTNELVVAFDNCPGFDSVVTLMATEDSPAQTIYLEQKVSAVQNPEAMRVSKIVSVLQFHYLTTRAMTRDAQLDSFKQMHVLFYEWGADPADVTVSKAAVTAAVSIVLDNQSLPRTNAVETSWSEALQDSAQVGWIRDCFDAYLSAEGDEETVRACVIGRADLEEWLVPPVAPIPLLVEAVCDESV